MILQYGRFLSRFLLFAFAPRLVKVVCSLPNLAGMGLSVGKSREDWSAVRSYLQDRGVLSHNDLDQLGNMRKAFLEAAGHLVDTPATRALKLVKGKCGDDEEHDTPSLYIVEKMLKDDASLCLPLRNFHAFSEEYNNDSVRDPQSVDDIIRRSSLFIKTSELVFEVGSQWRMHFKEMTVMAKIASMEKVLAADKSIREKIKRRFTMRREEVSDKEQKLDKHLYQADLIAAIDFVYRVDAPQEWRLCSFSLLRYLTRSVSAGVASSMAMIGGRTATIRLVMIKSVDVGVASMMTTIGAKMAMIVRVLALMHLAKDLSLLSGKNKIAMVAGSRCVCVIIYPVTVVRVALMAAAVLL